MTSRISEAAPLSANDARFACVLRLADNGLVLGHRLSQWCGHGPALEEDMALTNVALDLIGQANLWLALAGDIEGAGRSADDLAFLRDGIEFRNALLVEQPNGDFGRTIVRQFFFDAFHHAQLDALTASDDARIAEIAARSVRESAYHLRHSSRWVIRLGDGTDESHRRAQDAVDWLWRFTGELVAADDVDEAFATGGIGPQPAALEPIWRDTVESVLKEATLTVPDEAVMAQGGKQGRHGEHLGHMLAEMQYLARSHPGAGW